MSNEESIEALREALRHFETCLQTPIVSGELEAWLEDAQNALREAGAAIKDHAHPRHDELLQNIAGQHPELNTQVEELRATEKQLIDDYGKLESRLAELCKAAKRIEPDEGKLGGAVQSFIDQGLSFVLAARKQDTAVTTWYVEAFNRDAGVAD